MKLQLVVKFHGSVNNRDDGRPGEAGCRQDVLVVYLTCKYLPVFTLKLKLKCHFLKDNMRS